MFQLSTPPSFYLLSASPGGSGPSTASPATATSTTSTTSTSTAATACNMSSLSVRVYTKMVAHLARCGLDVQEVAVSAARTLARLVLSATRLPEVRYGGEFGVDRLAVVPAVVEAVNGFLGVLLVLKHYIYVTWHGVGSLKSLKKQTC